MRSHHLRPVTCIAACHDHVLNHVFLLARSAIAMCLPQVGYVSGLREVGMAPRRVLIYSAARSPEQQGRQRTTFNRWGALARSGLTSINVLARRYRVG